MRDRRTVLALLAWILPAAFLAFTGVAKLVAPEGTPPRSLASLLEVASWPTWLRVMGAVELALAALLALPRTRVAAAHAAFVVVAGLSALLALNAHDEGFVAHCGCMGAVRLSGTAWGEAEVLLLRNAALLFLLALVPYARAGGPPVGRALAWSGTAAALVLLALLWTAERSKVRDAREVRAAKEQGAKVAALGTFVPPIDVVAADGTRTTLQAWVQPLDVLLLVAPTCEHCARLGASIGTLRERVESRRGRLVVLMVGGEPEEARAWSARHGFDGLPQVRMPEKHDAYRLGVDSVPAWLFVDENRRVAGHFLHGGHVSLATAVGWSDDASLGLGPALWGALATRVAGPGLAVEAPVRRADGSWAAALRRDGAAAGTLFVRTEGSPRGYAVELAVALDSEHRILGAVPLARGDLVPILAPHLAVGVAELKGRTLVEAMEHAGRHLRDQTLDAPVWRSVHLVLERVRLAVAPPPGR